MNNCSQCANFVQHYILRGKKLYRIRCGHCTFLKVKNRRPDTAACEKFVSGLPDEDAFVSKEYLSKALLEHMLRLELLPDIHSEEEMEKETPV